MKARRGSLAPILAPIVRNLSWLVIGEVVVRGATVALMAFVARGMGAAAVGVLTVAFGALQVVIPLASLGQVEVLIREIARTPERALELRRAARRRQMAVLSACAVPLLAAAVWVSSLPDLRWTLLCLAPYLVFRVDSRTGGAAFKGLDRMEVETVARVGEMLVSLGLVALAALVDAPVWAAALGISAGGAVGAVQVLRRERQLATAGPGDPGANRSDRRLITLGLPFVAISVAYQLLLRGDSILLAGLGVPAETIGLYGAATAITWGLLAASQMIALALYPTLSRRAGAGRAPIRSALLAGIGGAGLGLALAAMVWLLREPLITWVYGAEFAPSARLLGLLVWALPTASASMVLGVVIAAWHRQTLGFLVTAGAAGALFLLDLAWVPSRGVAGAAWAAVLVHAGTALAHGMVAAWPVRAHGAGEGAR